MCRLLGTDIKFYKSYKNIFYRCYNKENKAYHYYGGRGIKCGRNTFQEFKDDMYTSYLEHINIYGEKQTTIDRTDVNLDYNKDNCRRATYKQQMINRRDRGEKHHIGNYYMSLKGFSEYSGIPISCIKRRIKKYGYNYDKIFGKPSNKNKFSYLL